jgi:hypothetical protein
MKRTHNDVEPHSEEVPENKEFTETKRRKLSEDLTKPPPPTFQDVEMTDLCKKAEETPLKSERTVST